jgi:hypothetical protein
MDGRRDPVRRKALGLSRTVRRDQRRLVAEALAFCGRAGKANAIVGGVWFPTNEGSVPLSAEQFYALGTDRPLARHSGGIGRPWSRRNESLSQYPR